MVCNNCGKQIKDTSAGKCSNCGKNVGGNFEGNGFFDILSSKEERESAVHNNMTGQQMNDKMISELVRTSKETNGLLKKQMMLGRITMFLSALSVVVLCVILVSFVRFIGKVTISNENVAEMQSVVEYDNRKNLNDGENLSDDFKNEMKYKVSMPQKERLKIYTRVR